MVYDREDSIKMDIVKQTNDVLISPTEETDVVLESQVIKNCHKSKYFIKIFLLHVELNARTMTCWNKNEMCQVE